MFNETSSVKRSFMKKELSDFLKIAYQNNRVRDLKEAFEEYPVEEEWHKGNAILQKNNYV